MEAEQKREEAYYLGHRKRLMERFSNAGLGAFSDAEALELLLSYALPRRDVKPLAYRLLEEFGGLHRVFQATPEKLTRIPGIGPRAAALITLSAQLWTRCEEAKLAQGVYFRSIKEIGNYLLLKAADRREEAAWLVCLDAKSKLLDCRLLCTGAVNSVNVPFRKLVETALMANATSVILAHNHTTGTILPSVEDIRYTRDAKDTLHLVDVILADHLILGERGWLSMRDSGML